jgi:PAT family beta-lactamase induction signal transducer AmpG
MSRPAHSSSRSAWFWVPSLYFSEGIPYVIVMTLSVVMYKRLGISNTEIAIYTSWLYLPWVLKPLWSPWVDITRSKRFWVVAMQWLIATALVLAAGALGLPAFFRWSLGVFWLMALASATHDIAADGFYMLGLNSHEQTWWVGWRSTFYRAAMIVGSGLLVVLAGVLESSSGLAPVRISVSARAAAPMVTNQPPGEVNLAPASGALRVFVAPAALVIAPGDDMAGAASTVIAAAEAWNQERGFLPSAPVAALGTNHGHGLSGFFSLGVGWHQVVVEPLRQFLERHYSKNRPAVAGVGGNVGVAYLSLSRPPPAGQTVVVNLQPEKSGWQFVGLAVGSRGFSIRAGERLVFDGSNWNQPAAVVIQSDRNLAPDTTVVFRVSAGNLQAAWSATLMVIAILFFAFSIWHQVMLPRPASDGPVVRQRKLVGEFLGTLGSFFQKPGLGLAPAFILFYRFDEAQLSKVISPFLLDDRAAGGLGLATGQVGLAYGTFGVLALTGGGLSGAFLAARYGLKKMLPFMLAAMYLPKLMFLWLAWRQPENFLAVGGAVALEQFGYGFGFTAFMLYLLYFAEGPHKTAHYAIATGFMALGMMVPGLWSGWLVDIIGYRHFFAWVIVSAMPGLVLALQLRIDPDYGRTKPA